MQYIHGMGLVIKRTNIEEARDPIVDSQCVKSHHSIKRVSEVAAELQTTSLRFLVFDYLRLKSCQAPSTV